MVVPKTEAEYINKRGSIRLGWFMGRVYDRVHLTRFFKGGGFVNGAAECKGKIKLV